MNDTEVMKRLVGIKADYEDAEVHEAIAKAIDALRFRNSYLMEQEDIDRVRDRYLVEMQTLKEMRKSFGWVPADEAVPIKDTAVLVCISGQNKSGNIKFDHAYEFAEYDENGWWLTHYPDAEQFTVHAWMEIPEFVEVK